jgi:cysteinyl-tRNA synthetase
MLPDDAFVLGVDSHTALLLDLEAGLATIAGLGGVTVRVGGRSTRFTGGEGIAIAALGQAARGLAEGRSADAVREAAIATADTGARPDRAAAPLLDQMAELEGTFIAALADGQPTAAVAALLDLDAAIGARVRAGEDSPDLDNASATFRSLIVRLGEHAAAGSGDTRAAVAPFVEALLDLRLVARTNRDWSTADLVRDRLSAAGIEVRDGATGSTWASSADTGS